MSRMMLRLVKVGEVWVETCMFEQPGTTEGLQ